MPKYNVVYGGDPGSSGIYRDGELVMDAYQLGQFGLCPADVVIWHSRALACLVRDLEESNGN